MAETAALATSHRPLAVTTTAVAIGMAGGEPEHPLAACLHLEAVAGPGEQQAGGDQGDGHPDAVGHDEQHPEPRPADRRRAEQTTTAVGVGIIPPAMPRVMRFFHDIASRG